MKNVILLGPRASGKSTIGRALSQKLNWQLAEMDEIIRNQTGKSIDELTEHGTNWQIFRQMEIDLLQELVNHEKMIISCGGGVAVNHIIKNGTKNTFGQLGEIVLNGAEESLKVVLLPNISALEKRVEQLERKEYADWRPILDEKHAAEIKQNNIRNREQLIVERVKSTLTTFKQREKFYRRLSPYIFDTGSISVTEATSQLLNLTKTYGR